MLLRAMVRLQRMIVESEQVRHLPPITGQQKVSLHKLPLQMSAVVAEESLT